MATYLYHFYTSAYEYSLNGGALDFYFEGRMFPPKVAGHSEVTRKSTLLDSLTITIQQDYELASYLQLAFRAEPLLVKVFEVQEYTPDGVELPGGMKYALPTKWSVLWEGKVSSWGFRGTTSLVLNCKGWLQMARQQGCRRVSSRNCNHSVYSANCGLNTPYGPAYVPLSGVVGLLDFGADGNRLMVYVPTGGITDDKRYRGGFLLLGSLGSRAYIKSTYGFSSTQLFCFLDTPWSGISLGDPLQVWEGCDKSAATCQTRFNNLLNFGGQPDLPVDNPITTS